MKFKQIEHTLLPVRLQSLLMGSSRGQLDETINSVQLLNPELFHTEESLKDRVFFDEPRYHYKGTYINAAPPLGLLLAKKA